MPPWRRDFLVCVLCLLAVLGILFHKSFETGEILFSNDGPLGAVQSQAGYMWSDFLGVWQDLNWVGTQAPSVPMDVSGLLIALCCDSAPHLGSVLFAKIYAPFGVFLLGMSALFLFRQLRFRPWVCLLGGVAAALNTTAFSNACWGLAEWPLSWAMNLFALAALNASSIRRPALKYILAGLAVGVGVMEGFDVGAIFSLFTAAYVFLSEMTVQQPSVKKATRSMLAVAMMALCAGLIAAQTVSGLISTQVKGVVGMAQDETTKKQRWDQATFVSLPKAETLRIVIPGLFGYRMLQWYGEPEESGNGSDYWGAVGQSPGDIQSRMSGSGVYGGVLVVLVAAWCVAQSFRKRDSIFLPAERKQIWCWLSLLVIALFLAWGRYAPFYQIAYAIPYFSTIRNPIKFMFPFSLALVILFSYGSEGLVRLYFDRATEKTKASVRSLKSWWKSAPAFEKNWTKCSIGAVAASLLGWIIYASSKGELIHYLQRAGFPEATLAESIARFSLSEVGLFILFLILGVGLLTLIMSRTFAGPRTRWAWIALGVLLVVDLGRANAPWIVYWNYKEKYASNPIIDKLREKPYEYRVSARLAPDAGQFLVNYRDPIAQTFVGLYFKEWLQHHFQYYRVQSLDIIQMPRTPEFDQAFMQAFHPSQQAFYTILNKLGLLDPKTVAAIGPQLVDDGTASRCARLWQLTNTRYILGAASCLNEPLNSLLDPVQKRFRLVSRFSLAGKPGVTQPTRFEELTAVENTNGPLALFEFTGALPRAKLFTRWQISTNDGATLEELRRPDFDPAQTVLVADELPAASPTNSTSGNAEIERYEPKFVRLKADAAAPSVLLLNDRYHPDWKVWVDGKRQTLLRCNYIMRGVFLAPGEHVVEFRFQPSLGTFYVSLVAWIAGVLLCGLVFWSAKTARRAPDSASATVKSDRLPKTGPRSSK